MARNVPQYSQLSDEERQILEDNETHIVELMDPLRVSRMLLELNVIDPTDNKNIIQPQTVRDQNRVLLGMIQTRGKDAFVHFVNVLVKSATPEHEKLARILRNEESECAENQLSQLKDDVKDHETRIQALEIDKDNTNYETELELLRAQLKQKTEELYAMRARLQDSEKENEELRKKISDLEKQVQGLNKKLKDMGEEMSKLKEKQEGMDKEMIKMKEDQGKQNEEMKNFQDQMTKQLAEQAKKMQNLEAGKRASKPPIIPQNRFQPVGPKAAAAQRPARKQ